MMTTISPIDNQVCFQCEFTPHKQINDVIQSHGLLMQVDLSKGHHAEVSMYK